MAKRKRVKPNPYPDVMANITLVEIGYQIDIFVDGKHAGSACRDFGGDWPVDEMKGVVVAVLLDAMQTAEAAAKRLRRKLKRSVSNG